MAKTLDQLPVASVPAAADLLLIQQGGLDRQISFGSGNASLQETLWANFTPRVVGTVVNVAQTANTVPWANLTGVPTTTNWVTIVNTPTTLSGYNITDAIHTNTDGVIAGNLTVTKSVVIGADLTVNGTMTTVHSTTIALADNIIQVNAEMTGAPPITLQGGIQVNRGSQAAYNMLWDEKFQNFRIGQAVAGDQEAGLQAVATRQDSTSWTANAVPFWNNTLFRFDPSTVTVSGSVLTGSLNGNAATASVAASANAVSFNNGLTTASNVTFAGVSVTNTLSANIVSANQVLNATWNDIADFVELDASMTIEYGKAYVRRIDGSLIKATSYMQKGVLGIASDTYGFGLGTKEGKPQIPLAIGGFVLACVDKIYEPGTPLTCKEGGYLTEMLPQDKREYPERMLATFDKVERKSSWNGIEVRGRHWVKVI